MKAFNYPDITAKKLASQMRQFLAQTENTAHSEVNPYAENDRVEVVRSIDWSAFNTVIEQLEITYTHRKQYGRK